DRNRKQFLKFHRLARNRVLERVAVQKLHDDKGLAVLFPDVVNGTNIGMVQSRGCFGFATKPFECLHVVGHGIGKKLKSNETVKPSVLSFVNDTHTACTE